MCPIRHLGELNLIVVLPQNAEGCREEPAIRVWRSMADVNSLNGKLQIFCCCSPLKVLNWVMPHNRLSSEATVSLALSLSALTCASTFF